MAKSLILLLLLQVGIGTTDPQATLDIRALPGDPLENTGDRKSVV